MSNGFSEEEFDEDLPVESIGSPHVEGQSPDEIGGVILKLIGDVSMLKIELEEVCGEREWIGLAKRLGAFRKLVESLPSEPQTKSKIGFGA